MDHGDNAGESCGSGKENNGGANCCGDPATATNCCSNDDDDQAKLLAAMKAKLTPMEFRVTQEKVTERPFSNRYNRHFEPGSYHCVVCDTELFRSDTKFESKSGWPAFYNVVDESRIKLKADTSHVGANILLLISRPDLARNEVSCAFCKSHLGHLFQDGPKPTGLRYCVNSNSLIFHPKSEETVTEVEAQINNFNESGISDSQTQLTSPEQTDKTDNPPKAAGESMPSRKVCINISNSNGINKKDKNSAALRRDSGSAASSTPNKGKFCIFTQCLPKESTATSSPETSPSTQKHYYKPSGTSTSNGKPVTENNAAVNVNNRNPQEPELKTTITTAATTKPGLAAANPRKGKVKGRAPPPPTLNLNKEKDEKSQDQSVIETVRRFGTDVPSPTSEIIETLTRRPSNGVLRETSL